MNVSFTASAVAECGFDDHVWRSRHVYLCFVDTACYTHLTLRRLIISYLHKSNAWLKTMKVWPVAGSAILWLLKSAMKLREFTRLELSVNFNYNLRAEHLEAHSFKYNWITWVCINKPKTWLLWWAIECNFNHKKKTIWRKSLSTIDFSPVSLQSIMFRCFCCTLIKGQHCRVDVPGRCVQSQQFIPSFSCRFSTHSCDIATLKHTHTLNKLKLFPH